MLSLFKTGKPAYHGPAIRGPESGYEDEKVVRGDESGNNDIGIAPGETPPEVVFDTVPSETGLVENPRTIGEKLHDSDELPCRVRLNEVRPPGIGVDGIKVFHQPSTGYLLRKSLIRL